ncbi:MAG: hypothetical protein WEB00_01910 [Dehalococcoidia bacterium]
MIIRWLLQAPDGGGARLSGMSLILENGDVHHFYAVDGDIHHSYNTELRGRYEHAVNREMARPGAEIVYQWGAV